MLFFGRIKQRVIWLNVLMSLLFFSLKATLVKGIQNDHFTTWPGMTNKLITKKLPPTLATAKGHRNQGR